MAASTEDVIAALAPLELDEKKIAMLENKPEHAEVLLALAKAGGALSGGAADKTAFLLEAATTLKPAAYQHADKLGPYIVSGSLDAKAKVTAAVRHLNALKGADFDKAAFEAASGVGVDVSDDEMRAFVAAYLKENESELIAQRYAFPIKEFLGGLKRHERMQWGNPAVAVAALDAGVLALLGPETAEDKAAKKKSGKGKGKGGKGKDKKASKDKKGGGAAAAAAAEVVPDPEETVFAARELDAAVNSERLLQEHAAANQGAVVTRFPPEPNGYLHIGHAKSMNLNFKKAFEYLKVSNHHTIFRYDDTNPEAESEEYIDSQAENVEWLGWKPWKVTFSSDYFDQLHAFAVQLIEAGKAYVCHQTSEQVKASREAAKKGDLAAANSPWRERSVEENLEEFEKMRLGLYEAGSTSLRMKMDMSSTKTTMWDPVAYRIKYVPHPRTGDKWCIYPSYDFTHCIVDSLEQIDYSLCTLEFEQRRDSYYWLLEALDLWRPHVFEFSRLNISHNVLSKRKIIKLVSTGTVRGWDDPRLLTINGLRRRGFTPAALNDFCDAVGVTRNENLINIRLLEHFARKDLDASSPRAFAVLNPLKVTLTNVPADFAESKEVADHPKEPERGGHTKVLTRTLYIDHDDFRMQDDSKYYGLAPGKLVGLRWAGLIKCEEVVTGPSGQPVELKCTYDGTRSSGKPKGNLHWMSGSTPGAEPPRAEVRLYEHLFTHETPDDAPGSWEDYVNPHSESIIKDAMVDEHVLHLPQYTSFQAERVGYFMVDPDTDVAAGKLVLNRVVTLKESSDAKAVRQGS